MMLDREADIRKECGGKIHLKEVVVLSKNVTGGTTKKSRKDHANGWDKDTECFGRHWKGHRRSNCPDARKFKKERSSGHLLRQQL